MSQFNNIRVDTNSSDDYPTIGTSMFSSWYRWYPYINSYCYSWNCDICPYNPNQSQVCRKGLVMKSSKCAKCKHNPEYCSEFEEKYIVDE